MHCVTTKLCEPNQAVCLQCRKPEEKLFIVGKLEPLLRKACEVVMKIRSPKESDDLSGVGHIRLGTGPVRG